MALIRCSECGKEVSDKASVCIHCGAPLNVKNGEITIKCCMLNGSLMKAIITDQNTGEELARIKQGEVVSFKINEDKKIYIECFGFSGTTGTLKFEGQNKYEISVTSGLFLRNLVFNKVDHIDSEY